MKNILKHIIIWNLLISPVCLIAQQTDPEGIIESIIESVIENQEEGIETAFIVEDLEELAENRLNINSASVSELSKLHLLNEVQIQEILNYRTKFGLIYSVFELNNLDGFTPELLEKIMPFIWFGSLEKEMEKFSETLKYGRHQFLFRTLGTVQIPKGFKEKEDGSVPYEGNRFRYYSRYRFQAGKKFSLGFTAEKDPGEAFLAGSNKNGFDFHSGHLSIKPGKFLENITIGDFLVRAGQGLVIWQGFSMGKSLNSTDIIKTGQGTRPFTSTDENLFFRGVSATLNTGDVRFNLFYSNKKSDANLVYLNSAPAFFSSLQTSGYHRTASEVEDKKSVHRQSVGGVFSWQKKYFKAGATLLFEKFDLPFIRSKRLYNLFRFSGTENFSIGTDYLYSKGKYRIFGEAAISKSKGKAFMQGAVLNMTDRANLSVLFRHFDKNYHALWGSPFAETSSAENETGMYFGVRILPVKFVTLSAYSDFYRSNWIKYTTAGPSTGWDVFTQLDFHFPGETEFYIRYKNEEREQKAILDERYTNQPERIRKIRFHMKYKLSESIRLNSRFESSYFKFVEKETGFLVYQDIKYAPEAIPLNLSFRLAYFSTESYNSRIYAYENDLLYTFSVPAFSGKGFRGYVNIKYQINEKLHVWIKIGETFYNDRESISSGYNEISGNQKTTLKFQLRLKI